MQVTRFDIEGIVLIEPKVFADHRGFFMETFNENTFRELGVPHVFVQDNHSRSQKGTLRGLHLQVNQAQAKLVRCTAGEIFDVAVDMRPNSPTFRQWHGVRLSSDNKHQFFIPQGFAHGFSVLSEEAEVQYKCSDFYSPKDERGVIYNDADLNIDWQLDQEPILSNRDQQWGALADFDFSEINV